LTVVLPVGLVLFSVYINGIGVWISLLRLWPIYFLWLGIAELDANKYKYKRYEYTIFKVIGFVCAIGFAIAFLYQFFSDWKIWERILLLLSIIPFVIGFFRMLGGEGSVFLGYVILGFSILLLIRNYFLLDIKINALIAWPIIYILFGIEGFFIKITEKSRKLKQEREQEKEKKRLKQQEERKQIERNEIKNMYDKSEMIINEAIRKAVNTKNTFWLCSLRNLDVNFREFWMAFENGQFSHEDAKFRITSLNKEANLLRIPPDIKMDSESETSVETYYDILNISSNASQEVIKKAYQEMVKQFHPDSLAYWANMEIAPEWIKKETNDKTKKIIEAYQVLRDPKKRKEYDESIER
jgi:hypothetical protein